MARKDKLTQEELAVVVEHVTPLIHGIETRLHNLPKPGNAEIDRLLEGQRVYLVNARSALRWVLGIAKQRARNAN